MRNSDEKWLLLAEDVKNQNEDPHINCLRQLMKLSHVLSRYLDARLGVYGLNRTQRRIIIFILLNKEPMTPTELSKLSLLTIETVNKSIDNLDKMKLTRSYRSRKDRRVRMVTLTREGLEMIQKSLPLRREILSQVTGGFSKGEVDMLSDFIERLLDQLNRLQTT